MKTEFSNLEDLDWTCHACNRPLELGEVQVEYMGSRFSIKLPRCPSCGLVLIPEDLAMEKMMEVEKVLEDK